MNEEQQYALIFIESLREHDKKTGSLLNAEILKLKKFQRPDFKSEVFSIQSKTELIALFDAIIKLQEEKDFLPHLHFEIHGFENGLELSNGDRINWLELMEYFSKINYLTKNCLVIYLAVCYGASILRNINPLGRAPFKALITPAFEITETQILNGFTSFYDEYFTSFDLKESIKRMNEEVGEIIIKLVLAEYCFDRITRYEPDSEFGGEILSLLKVRLKNENPWLQNMTEDFINEQAKDNWKNICMYLWSKKDNFLMKDIR